MLTRELMGALALAILWVNTLLIAAAALKQLAAVAATLRRLGARLDRRGAAPIEARVLRGDGRGGALAGHRIEQVGRAGAAGSAREEIVFADSGRGGEIYGGAVVAGGREIAIAPAVEGEVWVSRAEVRAASACPSEARFDEAYEHARRPRGFSRTVEARICAGAPVWLIGDVERDVDGADRMRPALVSSVDPRAVCRRKVALLSLGVAGVLAGLVGCTALALSRPRFGPLSTAGGALCLAFFLLVQPLGTALRDAARLPSAAPARGRWVRRRAGAASPRVASG
ncbi:MULTISPECIES: hypothetical protein [Sorangium]|uniref:Uncharacterized protein n=1 Tax=Sorangium cellulosum TaxID=56 RepID=A0A4P2QQ48_SORCE|nr:MULTISPECIES: hypothetical protein [Sorangium]AUX32265.1 uncharacterized protein SOCE836_044020 [Sorangium cellulosum]WCQ91638.1 hypothetical protein NQZ70_04361 [Sorangium sp. Soce836]